MSGLEAIAVMGFILQVVDTTITVIDLWKAANEVGEDVIVIKARLDMIRARLKSWALDWELKDGKHIKNRRFREFGFLAVRYLLIIQHRLTALDNFEKKFPSLFRSDRIKEGQGSADRVVQLAEIAQVEGPGASELKILQQEVADINHANILQRWKWARREGKGMKMVNQIATLVGELEDFFTPPTADSMAPVVFNQALTSNENLVPSLPPAEGFADDRVPRLVEGIARFKEVAYEMKNRSDALRIRELVRSHRGISNEKELDGTSGRVGKRSLAVFKSRDIASTPVMIEWRSVSSKLPTNIKEASHDQIHDLALLLHSERKPKEFRTLECIAMVDKPVSDDDALYGLIFKLEDGQKVSTLLELLSREDCVPRSLTERLKLVQLLSKALLLLHLGSWLHKGIRSDNILFLSEDISSVDLGAAYIGGFEYSRLFEETRLTQNVGDDRFENLYRHPDHQGYPLDDSGDVGGRRSFSYEADLYSLGVLLVEIGLWSPVIKLLGQYGQGGQDEVKEVRRALLDMIPSVRMNMGDTFANATSACLRSDFHTGEAGQPERIQEAYFLSVVRSLERCFL
ncbi:hypothetical protein BKA65DRAFT_225785 [Rhexocercosporidium sp. MPI-PUGE-AT-0058]|nr:hypothetical protein BKA65DRAFT_225785 [Rhexocercosporidium sp. MPI-PUGE-AT-0058]